jgi:hypothetical protein
MRGFPSSSRAIWTKEAIESWALDLPTLTSHYQISSAYAFLVDFTRAFTRLQTFEDCTLEFADYIFVDVLPKLLIAFEDSRLYSRVCYYLIELSIVRVLNGRTDCIPLMHRVGRAFQSTVTPSVFWSDRPSLSPADHLQLSMLALSDFFPKTAGTFELDLTFSEAEPFLILIETLLPLYIPAQRRRILAAYASLSLYADPEFVTIRLLRCLVTNAVDTEYEGHFADAYIRIITEFLNPHGRDLAFSELQLLVKLPDVGRYLAEWLAAQLPLIRSEARQEDTQTVVDLVTMLVAKQVLTPADIVAKFEFSPLLCELFPVVKSVVGVDLIRGILENVKKSRSRAAFLLKALDAVGPDCFGDSEAVLREAIEFWDKEHFELFCALAAWKETRPLIVRSMIAHFRSIPLDDVCAVLHIAQVGPHEIPNIVEITEALLFELDAARILPTLLQYPFLVVPNIELLFELAPINAMFLRFICERCSAAAIRDVRSVVLDAGVLDLLAICFDTTRDLEFLLRAAILAPELYRKELELELREFVSSPAFNETVASLLNSEYGARYAALLASFDGFPGFPLPPDEPDLAVVPFLVHSVKWIKSLRNPSIHILAEIYRCHPAAFDRVIPCDRDSLVALFERTFSFSVYTRLLELGHCFTPEEISNIVTNLRSEDEMIALVRGLDDSFDRIEMFIAPDFPHAMRTPRVLSVIFECYSSQPDYLVAFIDDYNRVDSAPTPACVGVFKLIATALPTLRGAGTIAIVDYFTRILYSHESSPVFPYSVESEKWCSVEDGFAFALRQLSPEVSQCFLLRYATEKGVASAFWLAPQQDDFEDSGTPLEPPVFLAVVWTTVHRVPTTELRYGTAGYRFVAGLDSAGGFSQKRDSPLNFVLYRRADVVCDESLKVRGLPIPIASTVSFCLERVDFALPEPPTSDHFQCVTLLMNKFACIPMFQRLVGDPAFAECFFAGDLPVLSDRDLWAQHGDAVQALARVHPSPRALAAVLIPHLRAPQSAPAAFALIHALSLPSALLADSIRAVLTAEVELHIPQFDAAVLRVFTGSDVDRALLYEFPRLTRRLCNDAAFFPFFAGATPSVQSELLRHASAESLLGILASAASPGFVLRAAGHFPSDPRFATLHAAVRPSPELAEQTDWVSANLAHPNPSVRQDTRRLLTALFPSDASHELLTQLQGALCAAIHEPYFAEVLLFARRFRSAPADATLKAHLIRMLVASDLDKTPFHEEVFELAASAPPIPLAAWEDCWADLENPTSMRRPLYTQQVTYMMYFFVESRAPTRIMISTVTRAVKLFRGAKWSPARLDAALNLLADSITAENVSDRIQKIIFVPAMGSALSFSLMMKRVLAWPALAESEAFIFAVVWLLFTRLNHCSSVLPAVTRVLKRVEASGVKIAPAEGAKSYSGVIPQELPKILTLREREPHTQVKLLKLFRHLAFVLTPCLTMWLGKRAGQATIDSLWEQIGDVSAAREFSKFVTEIVREALANPAITPEWMVKRRIDVWVEAFTMTLAKPVEFAAVEKHLVFAMALSKCSKVRYSTGSFWFQILNRLIDWDHTDFLKEYFVTIMDNGVTLYDKDDLINFINSLTKDDTLDAKLEVLDVIVTKLAGNEVFTAVAGETLEVLDDLLTTDGIPERSDLFDKFLLIASATAG